MATATHPLPEPLILEEYLHTAYHPDCDFVDGFLEERTMGGTKHSLLQMQLGFWFISHSREWNVRVMSQLRTRVGKSRVRLPDVTVAYDDEAMLEDLRVTPPLIAIEIVSPDDRLHRVIKRLEDYAAMGIPNIWVLDPADRVAFTYQAKGLMLVESVQLSVPASPIHLDLPELFASLDFQNATRS